VTVACLCCIEMLVCNVYVQCDRDVEDSLDSLLEDAGLEGTGSEDGMYGSLSKYFIV